MNWIDITIIIILIFNIVLGWSRGLIRSVTNLVSMILGFIAAKLYYLNMYDFLDGRFDLFIKIKEAVARTFSTIEFPDTAVLESLSAKELSQTVGDTAYLQSITEKFFESEKFHDMMNSNVSNFSDGFSTWLAENILNILSMVIVFLGVFIGIRLVGYLLSGLFELPLLKGVNKLSGFIFGLVKGTFFAMIFVLLLVIVGPLFDQTNIIKTLESSHIGIYFYKYNIMMIIFEYMI